MVPSVSRLIHRQSFFIRLTLPPLHPEFPHVSLLHAICAVAARFSAAVKCDSVEESLERRNGGSARQSSQKYMTTEEQIASESCFGERNAKYAVLSMKYEGAGERHVFEILQAQVGAAASYGTSLTRLTQGGDRHILSAVSPVSPAALPWAMHGR